MIRTTNNVKDFIENQEGDIFIYGAGMMGYWVGRYMTKCEIDFVGYIDRKVVHDECYYNGKRVYKIDELLKYQNKQVRVIVPVERYESILSDLLSFLRKASVSVICLTADFVHKHLINHGIIDKYDINKFLAYFRNRLYKNDVPTIISNDCFAGIIYQCLDLPTFSPTIDVSIEPDDFVKLCEHPTTYLKAKIDDIVWNWIYADNLPVCMMMECPAIRIKDITVAFPHDNNPDKVIKKWNVGRELIQWENMIYIFSDYNNTITLDNEYRFLKATKNEKNLLLKCRSHYNNATANTGYVVNRSIYNPHIPIETEFDLMGWLNNK